MAVTAARSTTVYVGGTSTATTGEACTQVSTYVWQISDAAKRAIDPGSAIVIYLNAVPLTNGVVSVDYAQGRFTISNDQTGDTITIDCNYIPLLSVGLARAVDITCGYETADASVFGNTSKTLAITQSVLSGTLEHLHLNSEDLDSGGSTTSFNTLADDTAFIAIDPGGTGNAIRGWVHLGVATQRATIADVVSTSVPFTGVIQTPLTSFGSAWLGTSQALWSITT